MSASRNGEGGIRRAGGNGSASVGGGTSSPRRHRVVRSQPARRGGTRLLYARLERLVSDSINGVCLDAFGYGRNYLIDIKYAVIVDVEATPARTYDEVAATKTMIKRTEERLGLKPERLAADTACGISRNRLVIDCVAADPLTSPNPADRRQVPLPPLSSRPVPRSFPDLREISHHDNNQTGLIALKRNPALGPRGERAGSFLSTSGPEGDWAVISRMPIAASTRRSGEVFQVRSAAGPLSLFAV